MHLAADDLMAFRSVCRAFRAAVTDSMCAKAAYVRIFMNHRFKLDTIRHPVFFKCAEYGRSIRNRDAAIAWHALKFTRDSDRVYLPELISNCIRNQNNGAEMLMARISIDYEIQPSDEKTAATIETCEICNVLLHWKSILDYIEAYKNALTLQEIVRGLGFRSKFVYWMVLLTVRPPRPACPHGSRCVCNAIFVGFSVAEVFDEAVSAEDDDDVYSTILGWRGPAPNDRIYTTLAEWQDDRALYVQSGVLQDND